MKFEKLEWDGQFFGRPVFRTQGTVSEEDLHSLPFGSIVYIFSDDLVELQGSRLVDSKVTYSLDLSEMEPSAQSDISHYQSDITTDELKSLALQSGEYSRFRVDPNIPDHKFMELYHSWIKKSVSGSFAKRVLVYCDEVIKGMLTLQVSKNSATIGLIAVDTGTRGKGIGRKLIEQSFYEAKELGASTIEVATQADNLGACRFYKSLGFTELKRQFIYHLHL